MSDKQNSNASVNNKRIAKNALMLYMRMFFTMGVSLYTSRVILEALGVEDFGVYNVVGGVVTMLSFVNSTLIGASARFITFSQGTGDRKEIQATFNCIVTMHYVFALLILFFAETIGLWFVTNKLVVPEGRMIATLWVYQSAVLAAMIEFISTPYNSLIVAHEKMSAFAYVSIVDKCIQLLIVYLLFVLPYDSLIAYAVLIVFSKILIRLIYTVYCKKNFEESHYHLSWDKARLKEIFAYAGWIFNGNLAFLGYTQGINILLNMFFGPVVNAARGVSQQVQTAVYSFTSNFQTAVNPQIIKTYASADLNRMHQLVLMSSRLGFYMMLIIVLPVFLHIDLILQLWLTEVPQYSAVFVRIMLIVGLNSTLRNPTITAIQATGDVKKFQLWEGTILLLVLPIAYMALRVFHIGPVETLCIYLCIELIAQFTRVFITYPRISLSIRLYFTKVLFPCGKVLISAIVFCHTLISFFHVDTFCKFLLFALASFLFCIISVWLFGLSKSEKNVVFAKFNHLYLKFKS